MARGISILERKQDRSQQGTPPLEHEMTHLSASHIDTYVQYNTREKLLNKDNNINNDVNSQRLQFVARRKRFLKNRGNRD